MRRAQPERVDGDPGNKAGGQQARSHKQRNCTHDWCGKTQGRERERERGKNSLGSFRSGYHEIHAFPFRGGGITDEQNRRDRVVGLALHEQIHRHVGALDDIGAQTLLADRADRVEHLVPSGPRLGRHSHQGHPASAGAERDQAHAVALPQVLHEEAQGVAQQRDLQPLHRRRHGDDDDQVERDMDGGGEAVLVCQASGGVGVFRGRRIVRSPGAVGGGARRHPLRLHRAIIIFVGPRIL